jgi:ABC-type dipeptide/oligopeptide/nickel transport system permease component
VLVYAPHYALVPVVTVAGMSFGYMFGWALIIESVFNIDGLSHTLLSPIQQRDFALAQGIVKVFTFVHPGQPPDRSDQRLAEPAGGGGDMIRRVIA